jgi:microcystin-dependent protein
MANSALGSQSIALLTLPAGTLIDYASTVEPSGWLLCDGRAVSRSAFASLFSAIGTAYGTGDGSTTFNIPDFRGRFARYNDNMGTAQGAAGRDTGRANGTAQAQATARPTSAFTGTAAALGTTNRAASGINQSNFEANGWGLSNTGPGFLNRAIVQGASSTGSVNIDHSHSVSISGGGDSETRPINLSCNKLIKI